MSGIEKNLETSSPLLDEVQQIYRSLYTYSTEAIFLLDANGRIADTNPSGERVSGYDKEELHGTRFSGYLLPTDLPRTRRGFIKVLTEGSPQRIGFSFRAKTGGLVTVDAIVVPIFKDSAVIGLLGMSRDITQQEQAVQTLDDQNRVLEMIAKSTPLEETLDLLLRTAEYQTGAKCSILRYDKQKNALFHLAAPSLPEEYLKEIDGISADEEGGSCGASASRKEIVIVRNIEDSELWSKYRQMAMKHNLRASWSLPMLDGENEVLGTFAMYYDEVRMPTETELELTRRICYLARLAIEQSRANAIIYQMAYHDSLTGLPNRRFFQEKLSEAIRQFENTECKLAVLYIDLDRFKMVNDSLGHGLGDKLLTEIARRLSESLGPEKFVARQGGDEFVVLLVEGQVPETEQVTQRIRNIFTKPFEVGGYELFVTPSIGISFYPEHGKDTAALMQNADNAMYAAKEAGKDTYAIYDIRSDAQDGARILLENDLRKSLERSELQLYYQPQISLVPNRRVGAEALLRWHRGHKDWVSPADFIPLAEETGLILQIGEWVIRQACRQGKQWIDAGYEPFIMGVNLSPRQFRQPGLVEQVRGILQETGYPPEYLELEITEGMTLDVESASGKMRQLRDLGVQISIDDFGTGYSSLNYLKRLPISRLKVDRSFVRDIETDLGDRDIVKAIIAMAHNLKITVIAEGVENQEQLSFLEANGCDEIQGYLFGRPVPADEFERGMSAQETGKDKE